MRVDSTETDDSVDPRQLVGTRPYHHRVITVIAQTLPAATASSTPTWVIPLITGVATLLGAIVGGVASFWTSTAAHNRQSKAEAQRGRNALIRDVSVRFLNESMAMTIGTVGLKDKLSASASIVEKLNKIENPDEIPALMAELNQINEPTNHVDMMVRSIRAVADAEDRIAVVTSILAEMRIVAPGDIVDKAQAVVGAMLKVAMYMPRPDLREQASAEQKAALNEFVNAVRAYMDLEPHTLKDDAMNLTGAKS